MCVSVIAPTYIPRNFRVMQVLDGSTVQFAWDPPLAVDEVNIRGFLKAYQVVDFCFFACYACLCV
jgi:hypothetical protein